MTDVRDVLRKSGLTVIENPDQTSTVLIVGRKGTDTMAASLRLSPSDGTVESDDVHTEAE